MERIELAEIAKIDRNAATDEQCAVLPYVGLEHIEKETGHFASEFIANPEDLLATKFRFTAQHVLYGKLRPYLNKVALPHFDGVCTTEILPLLPKADKLDRVYLWAYLLSPEFVQWASASVSGANLPRLDPKLLADHRIPLPPLPEQRRIAAILARADRLRRLRRTALQISDSYMISAFLDMFGDPIINSKGWDIVELSSLISDLRGGSPLEPTDFIDKGFPVLHKGAIKPFGLVELDDGKKTFTHDAFVKQYKRAVVNRSYVAVTLRDLVPSGPSIGLISKLEKSPYPEYILAQGAYAFQVDKKQVLPDYLVMLSNMPSFRSFLRTLAVGSTQIHIRTPIFTEISLPLPPLPLQQRFAAIAARYERLRAQQREALRQAEHLFDTLLHKAFRGELGGGDGKVESQLVQALAMTSNGELDEELVQARMNME